MPGICTSANRKNGPACEHRAVVVALDGESFTFDITTGELDEVSWTAEQKRQFVLWGLRRLRAAGLTLDQIVGRVTNGDEGTNVKQYVLLAKDVTKTNIGTAYVNIPPGLNGERSLIDFTGCADFRIILNMNAVGTGPWGMRIVRDSDSAVLFENTNITGAGEKELDTDWQTLPAAASGLTLVRLQGKSNVGADDPVIRRCIVLVR